MKIGQQQHSELGWLNDVHDDMLIESKWESVEEMNIPWIFGQRDSIRQAFYSCDYGIDMDSYSLLPIAHEWEWIREAHRPRPFLAHYGDPVYGGSPLEWLDYCHEEVLVDSKLDFDPKFDFRKIFCQGKSTRHAFYKCDFRTMPDESDSSDTEGSESDSSDTEEDESMIGDKAVNHNGMAYFIDTCPICLFVTRPRNEIVLCPACAKGVHKDCLTANLAHNERDSMITCPFCKSSVESMEFTTQFQ